MNKKKHKTDFLFPRPCFLAGAGTVFNLYGRNFDYNDCDSEIEADTRAIRNDWKMVAEDIETAIVMIEEKRATLTACDNDR